MSSRKRKIRKNNSKTINIYNIYNSDPTPCSHTGQNDGKIVRFNSVNLFFLLILVYLIAKDTGVIEAIKEKWDILEPVTTFVFWFFEFFLLITIRKK
jgi:hypothetical protein